MIILASQSPTRRALLSRAGVPFQSVTPDFDENRFQADYAGRVQELALALANAKGMATSQTHPENVVVAADQTLVCGNQLFHKPPDLTTARQQLLSLRGKTHVLTSAVSCAEAGQVLWHHAEVADITFRHFSDRFLDSYLDQAGPDILLSVGAYHYEGIGVQLMEKVTGSDHTILGLPLLPLLTYLRTRGLVDA